MEYNAEILRRQHRPEEAAGLMEDLSGIYLDVDSRNNLAEAGRLCRQLIENSMGGGSCQGGYGGGRKSGRRRYFKKHILFTRYQAESS